MRRIDKRADRVEISPEQLTAIVIDTEVIALCCAIQVARHVFKWPSCIS